MSRPRLASDNAARDDAGCIVTLRRRDDGELHSFHVPGRVTDALAPALAHYDASVWAVEAISTPRTILRDLQCGGVVRTWTGHVPRGLSADAATWHRSDPMTGERRILARCGVSGDEWIEGAA